MPTTINTSTSQNVFHANNTHILPSHYLLHDRSSTIRLSLRCRHQPILLPWRLPQSRPRVCFPLSTLMERDISARRDGKVHYFLCIVLALITKQHLARPIIHTLPSTGRQIVFTASTQNRVRTFDATTGELLNERQILPPWPTNQLNCSELGKTIGITGTPVVYTDYEDGIAFFYVKSYIECVSDLDYVIGSKS
jgi:hypothetical protein